MLCCAMVGCGKQNVEPQNTTTTIYGTVFNSRTHEPVVGAEVEIGGVDYSLSYYDSHCHRYSSSVSGTDGQFELRFGKVESYHYSYVHVRCSGYVEYFTIADFVFGGGDSYRVDINLNP